MLSNGCRALDGLGTLIGYQIQLNYKGCYFKYRSQAVGDKLHGREGNNPDRQLRSLNLG